MKNGFRQSMAWLHTWVGLTLGWVLFAIFVTGTSAFFKDEITQWMQPEYVMAAPDSKTAAVSALNKMQQAAPNAKSWYINLPTPRNPSTTIYWQDDKGFNNVTLNPVTGQEVKARDTRGGEFFYRFHFELYGFPVLIGRIIVGVAAMLMFVALISGIITHKKIITDFFTFRPRKGQRSWLDFHNVSSVLALPFFLMITYTGLAIFFYIYMPWGMTAKYGDDRGKFFEEISHVAPDPEPAGKAATMLPFSQLVQHAATALGGRQIASIEFTAPHDQNAFADFRAVNDSVLNVRAPGIRLNAIDGKLMPDTHNTGTMSVVAGGIYGLHMAHVAQWPLRWLLFLSGLLGCVMIATGMVLWTVKRRLQQQKTSRFHVGVYLVERLNVAAIIGLPAAMAAFFLSNRLIAASVEGRSALEIKVFLLVWLAMLIHALLRPWAKAWKEQLLIAGLLFVAVPFVNLFTAPNTALWTSLAQQHWVFAGFDLTMLALGLLFFVMLVYLHKHQQVIASKMTEKIAAKLNKKQARAISASDSVAASANAEATPIETQPVYGNQNMPVKD
jgi:uncharacterized iron-regulated membrane protein